jgi:hypothetical protein
MFPHTAGCFLKPFLAVDMFPYTEKHKQNFISIANYRLNKTLPQVVILLKPLYLSHFEAFIQKLHVTSRLHTQRAPYEKTYRYEMHPSAPGSLLDAFGCIVSEYTFSFLGQRGLFRGHSPILEDMKKP